MIEIKEKIAHLFKIASEEGAIVRWADGSDDAKEVINLLSAELDKLMVIENERILNYADQSRYYVGASEKEMFIECVRSILQHTIRQLKELLK